MDKSGQVDQDGLADKPVNAIEQLSLRTRKRWTANVASATNNHSPSLSQMPAQVIPFY